MTVIRTQSRIFNGAGVYTLQETFHKAGRYSNVILSFIAHLFTGLGLSPNITERELFDCPSRTAWLIAAWYDFSAEVADTIWYVDMAFC
jgi:hypothetical protein